MFKKITPLVLIIFVTSTILVFFYLISDNPQMKKTNQLNSEANTSDNTGTMEENLDEKASFVIFTNGTLREFSNPMYHNLSSDVYIDGENPNQVLVKKSNITWNDFFSTLPLKITEDCLTTGTGQNFCTNSHYELKFYLNGELDQDALDKTINNNDQLLISFGGDKEIPDQLKTLNDLSY